jgi:hypothetical protein
MDDKTKESLRRSQRKYQSKCKTYILRFRRDKDKDIIDRLERAQNKTDYVRQLVQDDIDME